MLVARLAAEQLAVCADLAWILSLARLRAQVTPSMEENFGGSIHQAVGASLEFERRMRTQRSATVPRDPSRHGQVIVRVFAGDASQKRGDLSSSASSINSARSAGRPVSST
jgi:hypothetical protein